MIDREHSGQCRHRQCSRRAVRAGVCPDHWRQLNGPQRGPAPTDLQRKLSPLERSR